jgi:hypothetical protein
MSDIARALQEPWPDLSAQRQGVRHVVLPGKRGAVLRRAAGWLRCLSQLHAEELTLDAFIESDRRRNLRGVLLVSDPSGGAIMNLSEAKVAILATHGFEQAA